MITNTIKLQDETAHIKINYTALTDMIGLCFILSDYELSADDAVKLYVESPNGELTWIDGTKDLDACSITFDVPSDFFPTAGESIGQIRITKDNKVLHSNRIRLNIHRYYGGSV